MPSLRHLLAEHTTLVLIDTASAQVQVGLWTNGVIAPAHWSSSLTEAATGLFACVDRLLTENGLKIDQINAWIFCEGPGSVLGIRMAAVALRSWQVIHPAASTYSYQSLDLVSRALNRPDVSVIADARRETWHVARLGRPIERVPTVELSGELVMPVHFRHWSALPAHVDPTGYDVAALFEQLDNADLLVLNTAPDAFLHQDPAYLTWTPQIHQAPKTSA